MVRHTYVLDLDMVPRAMPELFKGRVFRPTVRRIWTGLAIQLHRSTALPLYRAPALLRSS